MKLTWEQARLSIAAHAHFGPEEYGQYFNN